MKGVTQPGQGTTLQYLSGAARNYYRVLQQEKRLDECG